MTERQFVSVFKSAKRQEMYVYLKRQDDLQSTLPEALLTVFGEPIHVLDLVLTPEKKLARADATQVLADIREKGFFLQMPPSADVILAGKVPAPKDSLHG